MVDRIILGERRGDRWAFTLMEETGAPRPHFTHHKLIEGDAARTPDTAIGAYRETLGGIVSEEVWLTADDCETANTVPLPAAMMAGVPFAEGGAVEELTIGPSHGGALCHVRFDQTLRFTPADPSAQRPDLLRMTVAPSCPGGGETLSRLTAATTYRRSWAQVLTPQALIDLYTSYVVDFPCDRPAISAEEIIEHARLRAGGAAEKTVNAMAGLMGSFITEVCLHYPQTDILMTGPFGEGVIDATGVGPFFAGIAKLPARLVRAGRAAAPLPLLGLAELVREQRGGNIIKASQDILDEVAAYEGGFVFGLDKDLMLVAHKGVEWHDMPPSVSRCDGRMRFATFLGELAEAGLLVGGSPAEIIEQLKSKGEVSFRRLTLGAGEQTYAVRSIDGGYLLTSELHTSTGPEVLTLGLDEAVEAPETDKETAPEEERILIVENNAVHRMITKALVARHAQQVACTGDLDRARALFDDIAPTKVIIDSAIPEEGAYRLMDLLRGQRTGPQAEFVMLVHPVSAAAESRQALEAGVQQCLAKPVSAAKIACLFGPSPTPENEAADSSASSEVQQATTPLVDRVGPVPAFLAR